MNRKPWKYALLDMDRTFFDFPSSERRAFFRTMEEFSIPVQEETYHVYQGINDAVWRELEAGRMTHEFLRHERFRRLIAREKLHVPDGVTPEQIAAYNIDRMAEGDILYAGAEEMWQTIYRNYIVCVLTNGTDWVQMNRLRRSGLLAYTHHVITSQMAGAGKPAAGIFQYAMDTVGCQDKSQYVMIGDSLEADIAGAKQFGIHTIWYNPTKSIAKTIHPDDEVHDYQEMAQLLHVTVSK